MKPRAVVASLSECRAVSSSTEILQETYAFGSDPAASASARYSHLFVSLTPLRLRSINAFSSLWLEMVCTRLLKRPDARMYSDTSVVHRGDFKLKHSIKRCSRLNLHRCYEPTTHLPHEGARRRLVSIAIIWAAPLNHLMLMLLHNVQMGVLGTGSVRPTR